MTPMDELSAARTLASFEREHEVAKVAELQARTWEARAAAWERVTDLERRIRGHCLAYNLIPSVDVGALRD